MQSSSQNPVFDYDNYQIENTKNNNISYIVYIL
jgi:hypothetical protein